MSDELVTIATFNDSVRAALAKNFLDDADIPAVLQDQETVHTNWSFSQAVGGIKLQVRDQDADRAEELLAKLSEEMDLEAPNLQTEPALTAPPTAPNQADEEEAEFESENEADRRITQIFRSAIWGLLFIPLQFYTLYLLYEYRTTAVQPHPNQRWKIKAALLMNIPLWFSACLLLMLAGRWLGLGYDPTAPRWQEEHFDLFRQGCRISFPDGYGADRLDFDSPLGKVNERRFAAWIKNQSFDLRIAHFEDQPRDVLPERLYEVYLTLFEEEQLKARRPWSRRGLNGIEIRAKDDQVNYRIILTASGNRLYLINITGTEEELDNRHADRFIKSFSFE